MRSALALLLVAIVMTACGEKEDKAKPEEEGEDGGDGGGGVQPPPGPGTNPPSVDVKHCGNAVAADFRAPLTALATKADYVVAKKVTRSDDKGVTGTDTITVDSKGRETHVATKNAAGVLTKEHKTAYDDRDFMTAEEEVNYNTAGALTTRFVTTYTYEDDGREATRKKTDKDGVEVESAVHTYDAEKRLVKTETFEDGTLAATQTIDWATKSVTETAADGTVVRSGQYRDLAEIGTSFVFGLMPILETSKEGAGTVEVKADCTENAALLTECKETRSDKATGRVLSTYTYRGTITVTTLQDDDRSMRMKWLYPVFEERELFGNSGNSLYKTTITTRYNGCANATLTEEISLSGSKTTKRTETSTYDQTGFNELTREELEDGQLETRTVYEY